MAGGEQRGSEWDELGKIDYFLEHLARAVERGEVHLDSYETLAPRYLERRAHLADVIANRATRVSAPAPLSAAVPSPIPVQGPAQGPTPAPVPAAVGQQPPVRPAPKPVPWTTILTFTGAFLVIVASAIFAMATWDLFGVGFKLGFLGVLTAGFYGIGHLVRTRLKLTGGGVALTVVGSAMLLFDGWIAIDGYGLEGVWPWVGWLALCWAVYWFTETALGGGFFGLTGAAAQIAWVWLLGDGLGWPLPQRAAVIALVGLLWSIAGRAAKKKPPFTSLAAVLTVAAPITVMLAVVGIFVNILEAPAGWAEIASALVVGLAATLTAEFAGLPPVLAALGHAPAFLAIGSASGGAEVSYAVVLLVMALLYVLYEISRGGWGHGVLALFAELGGWLALANALDWASDVTLAVVVALACSWSVAAYLLASRPDAAKRFRGADSLRWIAFAGGWALLAACTLLMPVVREVVPLSGTPVAARDVALTLGVFVAWAGLGVLHRCVPAVPSALLTSFYAAAALMAWLFPEWHSALYATGLLAVAAVWLLGRRQISRITSLPAPALAWMARAATIPILLFGLIAAQVFFDVVSWQSAVLLFTMSVWWLADALTAQEWRAGLAVSSAMAVFGVAVGVAAYSDATALFGWPGALAGLALAALGATLGSRRGWNGPWVYGAASAATVSGLFALGEPGPLAIALALAAIAWVLAAWSSRLPEIAIAGGALAVGALLAIAAWLDSGPWMTFALLVVPSFAALVPVVVRRAEPGSIRARWLDAGLVSGLLGIMTAVFVPYIAGVLAPLPPAWIDFGGHGLAAALLALGAYVMVVGALRDFEVGPYLGMGLVLLSYLVERETLGVGTTEWVSTPIALYVAWVGYRWARTHDARVPLATDLATAVVGLGVPALLAANPYPGADPWTHLAWAVALSLVAIALGIGLRVRAYFFGGVASIVFTSLVRSWVYLASFWWLVLGLIGITMLVVALTWERQHMLVASARSRVREALSDWR